MEGATKYVGYLGIRYEGSEDSFFLRDQRINVSDNKVVIMTLGNLQALKELFTK